MVNLTAANDNQTVRADSRAGKFLTFFLASEEYGVEILKVQEIIGGHPLVKKLCAVTHYGCADHYRHIIDSLVLPFIESLYHKLS